MILDILIAIGLVCAQDVNHHPHFANLNDVLKTTVSLKITVIN